MPKHEEIADQALVDKFIEMKVGIDWKMGAFNVFGKSFETLYEALQELVPPEVKGIFETKKTELQVCQKHFKELNPSYKKEGLMADGQVATVTPLKTEVPIAVKQTTEMVNIPLDTNETVHLAQAAANASEQLEFLKDELKKSMVAQRGAINALKGTIREQLRTLAKGFSQELATVEHHYDFNTESIKVVYKGKVLKDRPMTEEEKQLDLEVCMQMGMELKVAKPANAPKAVNQKAG